MKRLTLTLLATLLTPLAGVAWAQGVAAPQGGSVAPSATTPTGVTVDSGASMNQNPNPVNANAVNNAQSARANAAQANPTQTREQATGGGVFGPSSGPGIFGPASTPATTTDIYGNVQPSGTTVQPATGAQVNQPATSVQGTQMRNNQNAGQAAAPTVYDASGNPVRANNLYNNQLPRDLNPITPNAAQPSQTQPSGSVTGR